MVKRPTIDVLARRALPSIGVGQTPTEAANALLPLEASSDQIICNTETGSSAATDDKGDP